MMFQRSRFRSKMLLIGLLLLAAPAAFAGGGGGGLPWETPLSRIAASLTGPVALSISLIALMVAGGTLVFGGELSEFARRSYEVIMDRPREIVIHQSCNRHNLLLGCDRELVLFAALLSAMLIFSLVT